MRGTLTQRDRAKRMPASPINKDSMLIPGLGIGGMEALEVLLTAKVARNGKNITYFMYENDPKDGGLLTRFKGYAADYKGAKTSRGAEQSSVRAPASGKTSVATGPLAPCPFCGSRGGALYIDSKHAGQWAVWCEECLAEGPVGSSEMVAAADWNTRVDGGTCLQAN